MNLYYFHFDPSGVSSLQVLQAPPVVMLAWQLEQVMVTGWRPNLQQSRQQDPINCVFGSKEFKS